jgi:two-component sensor histidine kinase
MREINHRAKNMLSLVHAIAPPAREARDFIGRFTERIQAVAANQALRIRNEWHGVDVSARLAHFADLVGSWIAAHGPKLRLNAAAAQAMQCTSSPPMPANTGALDGKAVVSLSMFIGRPTAALCP